MNMFLLISHIDKSSLHARYGNWHQFGLFQPTIELREQDTVEIFIIQFRGYYLHSKHIEYIYTLDVYINI